MLENHAATLCALQSFPANETLACGPLLSDYAVPMMRTLVLLAMFFLGLSSSRADLNFETTNTTYKAKPTDESFEAVFKFTNAGKQPVVIQKVDSNCGCISATTDKERYAPGESGIVTAVFKIGSAEGIQSKNVSVVWAEEQDVVKPTVIEAAEVPDDVPAPALAPTDAEAEKTTAIGSLNTDRLTVELHVPAVIEIDPKITTWTVGAPAETKTIKITMDHDKPIAIRDVRSSRENVVVVTKELEAGKRYELHLTPKSTESVQLGMLTIETDCDIKRHQKKLAFFNIHRPVPVRANEVPVPPPGQETPPQASDSVSVPPDEEPSN